MVRPVFIERNESKERGREPDAEYCSAQNTPEEIAEIPVIIYAVKKYGCVGADGDRTQPNLENKPERRGTAFEFHFLMLV